MAASLFTLSSIIFDILNIDIFTSKENGMKKRIALSAVFIASLLPMLLTQYGGSKGVQEISGLINLLNPIGILSVILFFAGVWFPFKKEALSRLLSLFGAVGMVASEVIQFFTWHTETITGEVSLQQSIRLAFPEFYVGLLASVAVVAVLFAVEKCEKSSSHAEVSNSSKNVG